MKQKTLTQEEINRDIYSRIAKLESQLQGNKKVKSGVKDEEKFSGAKGGVLLLVSKAFFSKKRSAPEVKIALDKLEYFYSIQVVQTTLNRLSGKSGPLIPSEEAGKKMYVKRK